MMKKTVVFLAAAILMLSLAGCGQNNNGDPSTSGAPVATQKAPDSASTPAADQKVYTPTFMYFVSAADENYEQTNQMIEELKKAYEGKVNFDIKNVDDDPQIAENYSVTGMTPALIMLNTKNEISAFEFKCNDKDKLVQDIEKALQ